MTTRNHRTERDFIGEVNLPPDYPFGINTFRAASNFSFSNQQIRPDLFGALIKVKKAAAVANMKAGLLDDDTGEAIIAACDKIIGAFDGGEADTSYLPPLHPFQGGAGTSTNMAANELIANLALESMDKPFGDYDTVSPLNHVNLSQSTNDTYPTAVKIAILKGLKTLHDHVEYFLQALLEQEKNFAHILKIGRTELQDAMPLSLGQEFSAWAESMTRFRWRLSKAVDWIREVNISGTAIGTGINADRNYALYVMDALRRIVQEPVALSRNLIDGTMNVDQIVEVSGLIKTGAAAVKKISFDLRLLSSGPRCGFGEIHLPDMQAGSSIMPGKVNPVMLEAAEQICIHVMGGDAMIAQAASQSNLELPQFLPYIAHLILENMEMFGNMLAKLAETVKGITVNTRKMEQNVNSAFSIATLLSPALGYESAAEIVKEAERDDKGILDVIKEKQLIDPHTLEKLVSPQVMASPGLPLLDDDDDSEEAAQTGAENEK